MSLFWRVADKLLQLRSYRPTLYSATEWDRQFQNGRWDYLENVEELAHHSVIAGYFNRFSAEKSLLDVGCGVGVLGGLLPAGSRYVGVDISSAAIERARLLPQPGANFYVSDAETYVTQEKFGAIVFNESLYYFRNPIETMLRLATALQPSGVIIASMYATPNTKHLWHSIGVAFSTLDEVIVENSRGTRWRIRLLGPARP